MEQGLKKFRTVLVKHPRIALDTPCLLYQIEKNPKYIKFTEIIFEELLPVGKIEALASTLLLTETLIRPFAEGLAQLVLDYKSIISGMPNLTLHPFTEKTAERAAYLRAIYKLPTPDSIHMATAIEYDASAIVGNDRKWKRVKEIETIILEEFLH